MLFCCVVYARESRSLVRSGDSIFEMQSRLLKEACSGKGPGDAKLSFELSFLALLFAFFGGTFLSKQSSTPTPEPPSWPCLPVGLEKSTHRRHLCILGQVTPFPAPLLEGQPAEGFALDFRGAAKRAFFAVHVESVCCVEQTCTAVTRGRLLDNPSNLHPRRSCWVLDWWQPRRRKEVS